MKGIKNVVFTLAIILVVCNVKAQNVRLHSDATWDASWGFPAGTAYVGTAWAQPNFVEDPSWASSFLSMPVNSCGTPYNYAAMGGAATVAMWADNSGPSGLAGVAGAGSNADNPVYFRKKFTMTTADISSGTITIFADDSAEVYLNGTSIGLIGYANVPMLTIGTATIQHLLTCGDNYIAIRARNTSVSCWWVYFDMTLTPVCPPVLECSSPNKLPKVDPTNTSNLTCSQIYDDGTNIGMYTTSPSTWWPTGEHALVIDANQSSSLELWTPTGKSFFQQLGLSTYLGSLGSGNPMASSYSGSGGDVYVEVGNAKLAMALLGTNGNVGINTSAPTEKIDVKGDVRVEQIPSGVGDVLITGAQQSGLGDYKLNYLSFSTSAGDVLHGDGTWGPSSTIATAWNGCSIDVSNNVVLGNDNDCDNIAAEFQSHREVPMNFFSLNFSDRGDGRQGGYDPNISPGAPSTQGRVGIGLSCETLPGAKLHIIRPMVTDEQIPVGLKVENNDRSNGTISVHGGVGAGGVFFAKTAEGCNISATDVKNELNIGGHFIAKNGTTENIAVKGEAVMDNYCSPTRAASISNIGGYFTASATKDLAVATSAYGVYAETNTANVSCTNPCQSAYGGYFIGTGSAHNVGIYASIPNPHGASGYSSFPSTNPVAAFLDGDVYLAGMYGPSDEKLKTDIKDFSNSLELLEKLDPKTYNFKTEEYKNSLNLPEGSQIGIMAKNMQSVFPGLVKEQIAPAHMDPKTHEKLGEDTKFLAVNYTGLIPVLVAAMKEMDAKTAKIAQLQSALDYTNATVATLQKQIDDICNGGCASLKGTAAPDQSGNQLLQNVPNPFSKQTSIGYVVNIGTSAYMNVNGLDGKLIKHLPITVNGAGSVNISSAEMGPGTYTYTLVVDSKVVDTKIMVITTQD